MDFDESLFFGATIGWIALALLAFLFFMAPLMTWVNASRIRWMIQEYIEKEEARRATSALPAAARIEAAKAKADPQPPEVVACPRCRSALDEAQVRRDGKCATCALPLEIEN